MNRPSNIPPNMPRLLHGHHKMRAPPPPLQSVAPPHALPPMGFTPQSMANVQQRPPRVQPQNYHAFMDNTNVGGGAPFVHHYNRMGGANPAPKKYHQLNKQRIQKPPVESLHHHQHQSHQVLQHPSYTSAQNKPEMPPNTSSHSRPPLYHSHSIDSHPVGSKKYPEIARQIDPNYQQTMITGAKSGTVSTESAPQDDVQNEESDSHTLTKRDVVVSSKEDDSKDTCPKSDEIIVSAFDANEEKCDKENEGDKNDDEPSTDEANNDNDAPFKSSREKTPMCLVNDLARFNKILFQYRLTDENGPAHCKRFTVTLKLGDEEYIAEGLKIKEAQHLAAKEAIRRTKYKHPIPKTNRRNEDQGTSRVNVTPTVELNALAMKLGLQTYYIFDPRQTPSLGQEKVVGSVSEKALPQRYRATAGLPAGGQQLHGSTSFGGGTFVPNLTHNPAIMHAQQTGHHQHHRRNYQHGYPVLPPHMVAATQHLNSTLFPTPCRITLIVGTLKFVGIGRTIQHAKHDAAAQAIEALKEQVDNQQKEIIDEKSNEIDNKSPISLVFEIGIKRNLPVDFKILREDGPAHMRTFRTACIVGQIVTEAEGTGKKISKKKAAQKMLEELNKLPPVVTPINSPTKRVKTKTTAPRKSATSHVKQINASENKETTSTKPRAGGGVGAEIPRDKQKKRTSDSESDSSNPITKLIELFQHNKEQEPVFKLITENGKERTRQRQFVVEVSSKDTTVRGVGNSKKTARRNAAQNLLMSLGLDEKDKPTDETAVEQSEKTSIEKVADPKPLIAGGGACQKSDTKKEHGDNTLVATKELQKDETDLPCVKDISKPVEKPQPVVQSSATLISTSSSSTTATTKAPATKATGLYMKDKLLYLARLMGFEVDFSDYPKGNHNEFLSIVMISTNPPQICHGIGANAVESQEDAASNALKILSEMGLNK